jgi:hypothetical protein
MRTIALALLSPLAAIALSGQICHAACKIDDACVHAIRSQPLHPATLGEALDAQRAVDVACRAQWACFKREADGSSGTPGSSLNQDLNPTVREFWKKQAEKEAQHP